MASPRSPLSGNIVPHYVREARIFGSARADFASKLVPHWPVEFGPNCLITRSVGGYLAWVDYLDTAKGCSIPGCWIQGRNNSIIHAY